MRRLIAFVGIVLLVVPAALFAAGTVEEVPVPMQTDDVGQAKYVFLFIGDGMAITQVNAAETYAAAMAGAGIGVEKLGFSQFPSQGLTTTFDATSIIADSASAGTAMATGNKTLSGVINMDPGKTRKFKTIAEYAKEMDMRVGVVSNVSLDHATPAAFYAKVPSRSQMYDICLQLAESDFDYFAGGGLNQRGRSDGQPSAVDVAKQNGFTVVNSVAASRSLRPGVGRVLAINPTLQDSFAMPYELDRAAGDLSLADYTKKGIELLDNPNGFFMMVEGGKIDWACHANDAAASIMDTIAFDQAVAEAVAFYQKHPNDTLIVVTGDHETGGMSIGFAGTKYSTAFDVIGRQKGSYVRFNTEILEPYKASHTPANAEVQDLVPAIQEYFGLTMADLTDTEITQIERAFQRSMGNEIERAVLEDVYLLYGGYEPLTVKLTQLVNQKAGIGWTSYSHTGMPVSTFALGVGASLFDGYYDNTEIFHKLAEVMRIPAMVAAR